MKLLARLLWAMAVGGLVGYGAGWWIFDDVYRPWLLAAACALVQALVWCIELQAIRERSV